MTGAFLRWMPVAICAGALAANAQAPAKAGEGGKSCGLLTPSELETALGAKVTLSGGGAMAVAGADFCTGQTPTMTVLLRLAKSSPDRTGGAAKAGVEMAKQMGAQVDVKTFGPITCSTVVPPPNLTMYGFNTTCAVSKATAVAAIEVTAKAQKDMVSIDRLRLLAEKMASRF